MRRTQLRSKRLGLRSTRSRQLPSDARDSRLACPRHRVVIIFTIFIVSIRRVDLPCGASLPLHWCQHHAESRHALMPPTPLVLSRIPSSLLDMLLSLSLLLDLVNAVKPLRGVMSPCPLPSPCLPPLECCAHVYMRSRCEPQKYEVHEG